jgi:type II secretory ATPase GspE/PulE/Tfp pilus assembly ATPase PilB-like protein
MIMTDPIRELIVRRGTSKDIENEAKTSGLIKLFDDGLWKVAKGKTTYEDLCRITAE